MAEEYKEKEESTKQLVVINRVLWTGISTTNKKLEENTKNIKDNTKRLVFLNESIKNLSKVQVAFSSAIRTSIESTMNKVAVTIAESMFQLDNAIKRVVGSIVYLTSTFDEEMGKISAQLFYSVPDTHPQLIWDMLKYTPGGAGEPGTIDWSKELELASGNIAKLSDSALNLAFTLSEAFGGNLEEWIGYSSKLFDIIKNKSEEGEGEKEKATEKGKEGLKQLVKVGAEFGKRQVIKAFQTAISYIKEFVSMGTGPVIEGILEPLRALGTILKIILLPLKPVLFGLELLGRILEAAYAPVITEMFQGLTETFDIMVGSIPELTEQIWEFIDSQGGIGEIIDKISSAFLGLINALVEGNLFDRLIKLSFAILDIALSFIKPKTLNLLISFGELIVHVARVLMPIIDFLTGVNFRDLVHGIYFFGLALAFMMGLSTGGIAGIILGGIYAGLWAAIASPLLSFQKGGTVPETGLIYAHEGETVHPVGKDDMIIELLQENVYLQKRILLMKEEKYR